MALVTLSPLEYGTLPIERNDTINDIINRDASQYGDLTPYENLQSKYYGSQQAVYNQSYKPISWDLPTLTVQQSRTTHISDELVRQFASGVQYVNDRLTFYKTALKSGG